MGDEEENKAEKAVRLLRETVAALDELPAQMRFHTIFGQGLPSALLLREADFIESIVNTVKGVLQ